MEANWDHKWFILFRIQSFEFCSHYFPGNFKKVSTTATENIHSHHMGLSENVGYIPNEIAIFHRDNDQQNHWVQWGTNHFQTHPYVASRHGAFGPTSNPRILPGSRGSPAGLGGVQHEKLQQGTPLLILAEIRWLLRQINRGSATIYLSIYLSIYLYIYIYATPPRPTFFGLTCVR